MLFEHDGLENRDCPMDFDKTSRRYLQLQLHSVQDAYGTYVEPGHDCL